MQPNTDESLEQVIAALNRLTATMHAAGFAESAHFIAMARLQVQLDLNGVTDRELRALCDVAEGCSPPPIARARPGQPRLRRDADMATSQRSFICQSNLTARRAGRRRNGTK